MPRKMLIVAVFGFVLMWLFDWLANRLAPLADPKLDDEDLDL